MPIMRPSRLPRRCTALLALIAAVVIAAPAVRAQQRHPVSGRVIAQVMGYEGAARLERAEREREEEPSRMELEAEALRFIRVIDVLPWQHILVFGR